MSVAAVAQAARPVRVALVTNIPAPYRMPVYERVASYPDVELCVFFCSAREPDREWDLTQARFRQVFLRERFITYRNRYIHCNSDTWARLREFAPRVVITTGFNPTFVSAYVYAKLHGALHVPMTDGTVFTESTLSPVHRLVRRCVYAGSRAFIGASAGSFALYRAYGIADDAMYQSQLCAGSGPRVPLPALERPFDFVFSGRFVDDKNPRFAMQVALGVAARLGRKTRLLMLGSGTLEAALRREAEALKPHVDVVFAGFVAQAELPERYAGARIMLFPTRMDTWGVVVNEAFSAGVPVLITPMAGAADELVVSGCNGYVLPLELERWVDAALRLLGDPTLHKRFADDALRRVARYSFDHAAQGIVDAIQHACQTAGSGGCERRRPADGK